ncbi:MAG: SHOCT domain-containing protein [Pseudonocardiaceae bacterium]
MGLWMSLVVLTLLAVLALAVLGSVWLIRSLKGASTPRGAAEDDGAARALLRSRYAAGEIDDEEFERRLAALTWR